MRRNRISFYLLLSLLIFVTSCLKDDDSTTVYPSDAAISSFVIGSLKQYVTVKTSSGSDSTYSKTVTGSSYKFYIDQVDRVIYNPDSLPYGTDVSKVLCTVGSKNSGTITYKKLNSDTLLYYSSSDSIDFSTPRTFRVFSLDGSNTTDYTVTVNVHKERTDTIQWKKTTTFDPFAHAKGMKALAFNGKIFVVVGTGTTSTIFSTSETDGAQWNVMGWNVNMPIPANAYENIVVKNDKLYLYCGGTILRSSDGEQWTQTATAALERLVAASSQRLFAVDSQGNLVSSADEGVTWKTEALDNSNLLLPTQDISYCLLPSPINSDTETLVLIGNRGHSDYPNDDRAQVWVKVIEQHDDSYAWMHIANDLQRFVLPRLKSLQAVSLGNAILATGGESFGLTYAEAFSKFYYSDDGGNYWRTKGYYTIPSGFECGDVFAMAADSQNNIWLLCGGSGHVWKGHSNYNTVSNPTSITK